MLRDSPHEAPELLHDASRPLRRHALQVRLAVAVDAAETDAGESDRALGEQLRGRVGARREAEHAYAVGINPFTADELLHPRAHQLGRLRPELAREPAPGALVVYEPPSAGRPVGGDEDEGLGRDFGPVLVAPQDRLLALLAEAREKEGQWQAVGTPAVGHQERLEITILTHLRRPLGPSAWQHQGGPELDDACSTQESRVGAAGVSPAELLVRLRPEAAVAAILGGGPGAEAAPGGGGGLLELGGLGLLAGLDLSHWAEVAVLAGGAVGATCGLPEPGARRALASVVAHGPQRLLRLPV
mmetsp:Transcript_65815/g.166949  ORF Transcript_65815/g.166949 Transcript_65815/m.166949 type:complete len:300 (+) Transcript_65815:1241-2140(+)